MANWMESKTTIRKSNTYEMTSFAKGSTKPNHPGPSSASNKTSDSAKLRKKLEDQVWSSLIDFNPNAAILKTLDVKNKIMRLVEKYCQSKGASKNQSCHATKTDSSNSKSLSKPTGQSTESAGVKKSSSGAKPTTVEKSYTAKNTSSAVKSFATTKSCASKKTSINSNLSLRPDKLTPQQEMELKRLAPTDGFVQLSPVRWKRVSKPVKRFSIKGHDEEKRLRSSHGRQISNRSVSSNAIIKEKPKSAKRPTTFAVNERQTLYQTTSQIGAYHMNELIFLY